jgi:hypothetical protein
LQKQESAATLKRVQPIEAVDAPEREQWAGDGDARGEHDVDALFCSILTAFRNEKE